jgi:NAD+ diphosphatase
MSSLGELNRAAELRTRPEVLARLEEHVDALFTFTWRSRNLVSGEKVPTPVLLDRAAAAPLGELALDRVFLGLLGDRPVFALGLPGDEESAAAAKGLGYFNDLRLIGQHVAEQDARLLAYARGVLHWHRHHRHCGKCGAKTRSTEGGHVRVCTGCDKRHFPRSDPAIMALIVRGDRVLLARQPKWPTNMYSVLAGFVEPGESIEEAVEREVDEEVGLSVRDIRYVRSQPWPFPSSLMIGYAMHSDEGGIELRDEELEEARWTTREEIVDENNKLFVPPTFSLAGQMIELFMKGEL